MTDSRDHLTADEFYTQCAANLAMRQPTTDVAELFEVWGEESSNLVFHAPCPLCGEQRACGYDAEGRPLIHAREVDA